MKWREKATKKIKKYWNIDSLKDKQVQVIDEILNGHDVVGLLPTGYGKSMCYLIPPLITKGTMFIISPLISLMEDQINKLSEKGIKCAALNSNNKNKSEDIHHILDGSIRIVFMSPEYLLAEGLDLAAELDEKDLLGFIAIDESHCVSSWGHDFRQDYREVKQFRERFPDIPIMALTATATVHVLKDVIKVLKLDNPQVVRASFDRPNLNIKIEHHPKITKIVSKNKVKEVLIEKAQIMKQYMNKYKDDKIIIYINSRKECEKLETELNKISKNCSHAYHAGMSKKERDEIQKNFSNNTCKIIISTIAFGMGIDQIVKCVVIFGCPSSIEEFYQQIGRGGRDGLPCETVLYYNGASLQVAKYMINKDASRNTNTKVRLDNLKKVEQMVYLKTCYRKYILEYFGETCDFFTCTNCSNCSDDLEDMTDKLWPIIMRSSNDVNQIFEFINTYLIDSGEKYTELIEPLKTWKKYIIKHKILRSSVPDNMKVKISKKFIKVPVISKELTIDEKLSKYENIKF